jgi:group I intron endonuclease
MPRKIIDYSKTVIYHFICNDKNITDTYVGSTTDFRHRKTSHKNNCINEKNRDTHYKLYENIRKNGGWDNWKMTPLEEYNCKNKTQVRIREQYWIDKLQPIMNECKSFRTEEERLEQLKQFRITNPNYGKDWNDKNRDHINERKREQITCECGCVITKNHKSNHLKTKKHLNILELNDLKVIEDKIYNASL